MVMIFPNEMCAINYCNNKTPDCQGQEWSFLAFRAAKIRLLGEHLFLRRCIRVLCTRIQMITIIQSTNRPDSNSEFVSRHVSRFIGQWYEGEVGYVSMTDLPSAMLHASSYEADKLPQELKEIQDRWLIPAEKFVWILPEYNGSFPGVLKAFIDAISVRQCDETFKLKKSMLIGVATGRSGNIRGMDHLAGILLHMKSVVYPRLLPISLVHDLMDEEGRINHEPTLKTLEDHLTGFVTF